MARAGLKKAPVKGPAAWEEKGGHQPRLRPLKDQQRSLGLGQVTCDLSCLPGAYLLLPAPEALPLALRVSRTRGNPDLIALSFMGNRKAQHGTKGFS